MDPQYYYLYSNAITTHCGSYKETYIKQHSTANAVVLRMASVYQNDPKIKTEVDSWLTNENSLVCNLGHAIVLKASHPDLCFSEQYDFESFEKMSGELDILGLSPWNDYHIFRAIDAARINRCTYYFYDESDCKKVKELLPSLEKDGRLNFLPSGIIWENRDA